MTLTIKDHVVVVGAGLAGWRFCEALRGDGYEGAITLVGDEDHMPYERPPLSKQVLSGKWEPERAGLTNADRVRDLSVSTILGRRVVGLNIASTSVELDDATMVVGTHVVLATGTRARALSLPSGSEIPTLRSRNDVERIISLLEPLSSGSSVVVIGGGFLGAESATSLKARGFVPIVLEVAKRPLQGVLGEDVATWLERLPGEYGVELRTNQRLLDVEIRDGTYRLYIEGAETLTAPFVMAAVGSELDCDWVARSGLRCERGVVVNEHLEASERVGAIGDVASFPLTRSGVTEMVRVEHWQVATDHAAQLARYWTRGEGPPSPFVPYFWSDQYGKKIQLLGYPKAEDEVTLVSGSVKEGKWLALYHRDGALSAVIALSQPRALMLSKPLLEQEVGIGEALELAPWNN